MNGLQLQVAGFVFCISTVKPIWEIESSSLLSNFVSNGAVCDFSIQLVLQSESVSTILQDGHSSVEFFDCSFSSDFRHAEVRLRTPPDWVRPSPEVLLEAVIMIVLSSSGRALPLHACGIDDGGTGLVFAGPSDSGKTTMAGQWQMRGESVLLGDERVWLRRADDGEYWLYGSPLPSALPCLTPHGRPLSRVFFIQHGAENTVRAQTGVRALTSLLRLAYPRFHRRLGLRFPVDFCLDVVRRIPCYDLAFRPDGDIVDFVRAIA